MMTHCSAKSLSDLANYQRVVGKVGHLCLSADCDAMRRSSWPYFPRDEHVLNTRLLDEYVSGRLMVRSRYDRGDWRPFGVQVGRKCFHWVELIALGPSWTYPIDLTLVEQRAP